MNLAAIDANLLIALDVLLEECHVTRSATRLGVTQSAMSQTLQRLRSQLGDPLLVRSGRAMVLTPRARAMAGPLRYALAALHHAINETPEFDPATDEREFRVGCLDTYASSVLPRLIAVVARVGPKLSLDVVSLDVERVWEDLRRGGLDLALVGPWNPPADIETTPFLRESMVSMVRSDHPILDAAIDPEAFCRWPHATFHLTGRGTTAVDRRLATLGLHRRVVARAPYFLSAPALAVDGELIVTVPRSAAKTFADRWPVTLFDLPFEQPMTYTLSLAWPPFLEAEPSHRWLRQQLMAVGATLCAEVAACSVKSASCAARVSAPPADPVPPPELG